MSRNAVVFSISNNQGPSSGASLKLVPSSLWPTAKRLFWVVMLLLHAGAIRSLWTTSAIGGEGTDLALSGLRFGVLLASAVFFGLKSADVPWLRLRPGWRPFIASVVVVALLHVNVVRRVVDEDSGYSPAPIAAILLFGGLAESGPLRREVRRFVRFLAGDIHRVPTRAAAFLHRSWTVVVARCAPIHALLDSLLVVARPPPCI